MHDTTTFVFIRHGAYPRAGSTRKERDAESLAPLGRAQALAMGRWLAARGYRPGLVVHTDPVRAKETAQEVVSVLGGDISIRPGERGFRSLDTLDDKLVAWTEGQPRGLVLFCGHDTTQGCLRKSFQLNVPRADRAVVVLHRVAGTWDLVEAARCRAGVDPPIVEVVSI